MLIDNNVMTASFWRCFSLKHLWFKIIVECSSIFYWINSWRKYARIHEIFVNTISSNLEKNVAQAKIKWRMKR